MLIVIRVLFHTDFNLFYSGGSRSRSTKRSQRLNHSSNLQDEPLPRPPLSSNNSRAQLSNNRTFSTEDSYQSPCCHCSKSTGLPEGVAQRSSSSSNSRKNLHNRHHHQSQGTYAAPSPPRSSSNSKRTTNQQVNLEASVAIASTPLLVQKSAKERRKSLQRSRSIKEDQIQVDVEIVQEPDHLRRQLTSDGDDTLNKVNSLEQDEDMTGKVSFNYYGSTNVIYK